MVHITMQVPKHVFPTCLGIVIYTNSHPLVPRNTKLETKVPKICLQASMFSTYMHARMHACALADIRTCTYICEDKFTYVCIYVCICMYTDIDMEIYTVTYILTDIHKGIYMYMLYICMNRFYMPDVCMYASSLCI